MRKSACNNVSFSSSSVKTWRCNVLNSHISTMNLFWMMVIGLLRVLWGALSKSLSPPSQQHPHNSMIFLYLAKPLFQRRDSFQVWWMQRCMKFCFSSTDMFAALRLVLFSAKSAGEELHVFFLSRWMIKTTSGEFWILLRSWLYFLQWIFDLLTDEGFPTRLVLPLSPQVTLDQEGPPRTYAENLAVPSSGLDSESMWSGQWLGRVCPGAMLRRGPFEPRFKTPDLACNPKPDRLVGSLVT